MDLSRKQLFFIPKCTKMSGTARSWFFVHFVLRTWKGRGKKETGKDWQVEKGEEGKVQKEQPKIHILID